MFLFDVAANIPATITFTKKATTEPEPAEPSNGPVWILVTDPSTLNGDDEYIIVNAQPKSNTIYYISGDVPTSASGTFAVTAVDAEYDALPEKIDDSLVKEGVVTFNFPENGDAKYFRAIESGKVFGPNSSRLTIGDFRDTPTGATLKMNFSECIEGGFYMYSSNASYTFAFQIASTAQAFKAYSKTNVDNGLTGNYSTLAIYKKVKGGEVVEPEPVRYEINLSIDEIATMYVGDKVTPTIKFTNLPADVTEEDVLSHLLVDIYEGDEFYTTEDGVISIDENGTIEAIGAGMASIHAYFPDNSDFYTYNPAGARIQLQVVERVKVEGGKYNFNWLNPHTQWTNMYEGTSLTADKYESGDTYVTFSGAYPQHNVYSDASGDYRGTIIMGRTNWDYQDVEEPTVMEVRVADNAWNLTLKEITIEHVIDGYYLTLAAGEPGEISVDNDGVLTWKAGFPEYVEEEADLPVSRVASRAAEVPAKVTSLRFIVGEDATNANAMTHTSLLKNMDVTAWDYDEATTGIRTVVPAAEGGEVKYFDIQGRRVINPEAGRLYIRVEGTTATKVIL